MEVLSWWMLDLARAASGDKYYLRHYASPAEMLLKLYWWDYSKFSLAVTSVINTYLVAFAPDASMGEL